MMNFCRALLRHKIYLTIIAIVIIGGGYIGYKKVKGKHTEVRYVTQQVVKGTLTSSVSGTGQVEASNRIDIKPTTDGRLTSVRVKENQEVKEGDVIAIIDQQSAANSVAQARASLEQAQADYDKLIAGATKNEVASQQLSVDSAERALAKARQDYENTVVEQQNDVDQALSNLFNNNLQADSSDLLSTVVLTLSGRYAGKTQGKYSISIFSSGDGYHYQTGGLGSETGYIQRGKQLALGNGLYVTFSSTGNISPSTVWTIDVPNQKSGSYQTALDSYESAMRNQKTALQNAQNAIDSAQNSLDRARISYNTTVEPPTNTDIASAKARITSARAQLANAQTVYENTVLKAPFDGVVASLDFSAGDKVTAGTAVATLITKQQVATFSLNEVDAARVKVGQKATMTFSAVSDLAITGKVADIDNIGTVSQNVVSFNVKVVFDTQNESIKPGMSVSVDVITNAEQDVLTVPTAAIKTLNGTSYVQVLTNGKPEQREVTVGSSNDTDTVVTGDIKEGDEIVTQTVTASNSAGSSGTSLLQGLFGGNRSRSGNSSSGSSGSIKSSGASPGGNQVIIQQGPPGM